MIFVLPMAGESRRFQDAGHIAPKFMLPLGHGTVFDQALASFSAYFASDEFLFVLRREHATEGFVRQRCGALGVAHAHLVLLDAPTAGQAETVLLGLDGAAISDNAEIAVFNIDTFRPDYRKPDFLPECDGYLEVFEDRGENWSFVRLAADGQHIAEAREKSPISNLACTGLYHFRMAGDFRLAYHHKAPAQTAAEARECYVAPLYNVLIAAGRKIRYQRIERDAVVFCGTPQEYDALRAGA